MATILVVEDSPDIRALMKLLLEAEGHRVALAGDGQAAIAATSRERPDLILMDIQLPDLDGGAALGRLRADPGTAGICVVALTAQAMGGDLERLLGAGFDGYLTKPISIREFPDQVRHFCERARPGG